MTFERYHESVSLIARHPACPEKPGLIREILDEIRTAKLTEEQRQELRAILSPDGQALPHKRP